MTVVHRLCCRFQDIEFTDTFLQFVPEGNIQNHRTYYVTLRASNVRTVPAPSSMVERVVRANVKPRLVLTTVCHGSTLQAAGLTRVSSSDGVLLDQTVPVVTGEWFVDGTDRNRNRDFFSDGVIVAQWAFGFFDGESFIDHFEVQVDPWPEGASEPGAPVFGPAFWGKFETLTLKDLTLEHKTTYKVVVRAYNGAGGSARFSTRGQFYDETPPETDAATVNDGSELMGERSFPAGTVDLDWAGTRFTLYGTWEGFTDPESSILNYHVNALDQDGVPIMEWMYVPRSELTARVVTPGLRHGDTYFFAVRATNFADNTAMLQSDGVRIDLTLPGVLTKAHFLVNGERSRFMGSRNHSVSVAWAVVDPESGVRCCSVGTHKAQGLVAGVSLRGGCVVRAGPKLPVPAGDCRGV